MFCRTILIYCIFRIIAIQPPTDLRIVITAGYIVESNLGIVVVATITEGVDCSNTNRSRIVDSAYTPSIVGVACNDRAGVVGDSDDVALKVLQEVVRSTVVLDTANSILVIPECYECIIAPSFTEYLCTVKQVVVYNTAYSLAGTNTVSIVGVFVAVEGVKLTSLSLSNCMT